MCIPFLHSLEFLCIWPTVFVRGQLPSCRFAYKSLIYALKSTKFKPLRCTVSAYKSNKFYEYRARDLPMGKWIHKIQNFLCFLDQKSPNMTQIWQAHTKFNGDRCNVSRCGAKTPKLPGVIAIPAILPVKSCSYCCLHCVLPSKIELSFNRTIFDIQLGHNPPKASLRKYMGTAGVDFFNTLDVLPNAQMA